MEQVKRYAFEDEVIEVPLRWDEDTQTYVEDYKSVIENPIYSPSGRPVLLTIEDACPYTDMADADPDSIDCGSCRHYHQFPGSLLVGLVPKAVLAVGTDTGKAIQLGTGGITGYSDTNSYDYIYFGDWTATDNYTASGPIKWRVLDDQTNTGGRRAFPAV